MTLHQSSTTLPIYLPGCQDWSRDRVEVLAEHLDRATRELPPSKFSSVFTVEFILDLLTALSNRLNEEPTLLEVRSKKGLRQA